MMDDIWFELSLKHAHAYAHPYECDILLNNSLVLATVLLISEECVGGY